MAGAPYGTNGNPIGCQWAHEGWVRLRVPPHATGWDACHTIFNPCILLAALQRWAWSWPDLCRGPPRVTREG